uniref:Plectin/eS10 N-terminal domain-containing protein n=1 Tax=Acanthochromis polyacanthus TaxID=80966 RepID=A0A3Q1GKK4_9TELE
MVMPLADLRAIYELLLKDGAIVVKKDKRPTSIHPDIEGVNNLKVLSAMASLKSRGYIRETFVWKHAYYYLTNEGIFYLRDYLHLPPEIIPTTLRRILPSASSALLQDSKFDISKPQTERKNMDISDRHVYRHKREESDRHPRNFRDPFQPRAGRFLLVNLGGVGRGRALTGCSQTQPARNSEYNHQQQAWVV